MKTLYEKLFNSAPIPVIVFHRENLRNLAVNPAAIEFYGYTREEFLSLDCLAIRPQEDIERFKEIHRVANLNAATHAVSRHLKKDGTLVNIRIFGENYDFDGVPVRVCFVKGISEPSRESSANTTAESFKQVAASNVLGMFSWDITGKIHEANEAFLYLLGFTQEDLANGNLNWHNISPVEGSSSDLMAFEELSKRGMHTPFEKELIRKDGSRATVMIGGAFVENSKTAGMSFVVDLSEHKRLDQELKKAIATRDEFLSIASHELRTPMTPLQSLLELLLKQLKSGKSPSHQDLTKMIESADHQVKRMVKLVNSLLDVSRIHTGKLQLDRSKVNLADVVKNVVQDMSEQLKIAQCETKLELAPDAVGNWDQLRLEQVITNLISNVCKYASRTPVHVVLETTRDRALLAIRDQGPGIPEDLRDKIFDRFERGASRSGTSGFGLGLFISKQIIQAHGGSIWVECAPATPGSSFIIDLPRS